MKKVKEFISNNRRIIIAFISIVVFIALAEDIFEGDIMKCDTIAYFIIMKARNYNILTPIAKIITNLGSAITLIILSILSLALVKNKKIGLCIIGNLGCITITNLILKHIVQRPRPEGYRIINETRI